MPLFHGTSTSTERVGIRYLLRRAAGQGEAPHGTSTATERSGLRYLLRGVAGQGEAPHGTSASAERVGTRYLLRRAARRRPISEELELIQNSMLVLSIFFSHIGNGGEYTVDNFIQSLPRVEISTLERDELECSICKLEYGTPRGNTSTVAALDPGLPGEEDAEKPVKLSCGHVFGDWCIKRWLLEQPPSCPICRFEFSSIALNYRLEELGADE